MTTNTKIALMACAAMLVGVSACGEQGQGEGEAIVCWDNDQASLCFEGQPASDAVCYKQDDQSLFCSSNDVSSAGNVGSTEQAMTEPNVKLPLDDCGPVDAGCGGGLPSYDCFMCWVCLAQGGFCAIIYCPRCAGLT